jgi:hypothetical protein
VCYSAFPHSDKYLRERGKGFFCLTVSEASVHNCLASSLWAYGEAEHHGEEGIVEQSCSFHGVQEAERDSDRKGTRYIFQRHAHSDLLAPPSSHLLTFLPPHNNATDYDSIKGWFHWLGQSLMIQLPPNDWTHQLGTKHSTHELLGGHLNPLCYAWIKTLLHRLLVRCYLNFPRGSSPVK